MKLFYLPLEPYVERYTYFMSAPGGWAEDNFKRYNVDFVRVEGNPSSGVINNGVVLDAVGRNKYAMSQLLAMIKHIEDGDVKDGDVIYTEDFWHPGIESLFYIRSLCGIEFKVGCFIHAQTFDEYDFCAHESISFWMRPIEFGYAKGYDYIFTCSNILRSRLVDHGFDGNKIFKFGLPYNSKSLLNTLINDGTLNSEFGLDKKENFVLFSSRFDSEKNPHFFLNLVEKMPNTKFKLVNPRSGRPISNDESVIDRLAKRQPKNLEIVPTTNKADYYRLLSRAKVQFNCALQDWVSWTLLEAITFRCNPVYPDWRDFPFEIPSDYIYANRELNSAEDLINTMMSTPFKTVLDETVREHDKTWFNYLKTMGLI